MTLGDIIREYIDLGAGCRRFESCHPDMRKKSEKPRNSAVFQTFSIEKAGV